MVPENIQLLGVSYNYYFQRDEGGGGLTNKPSTEGYGYFLEQLILSESRGGTHFIFCSKIVVKLKLIVTGSEYVLTVANKKLNNK